MTRDLVLNDRYRLVERLATGGMGEVWRAADQALARAVAVKLLRPELMSDAGAVQRFRSEARFTAALRHEGIAQVYDVGVQDGRSYLVMELVEGEPLEQIIERAGALPPAAVLDLLAQSGRALAAAHEAGIVHRDIKPANLMVTGGGAVKITDFGIARRLASQVSLTQAGMVMGTAFYISPEQASGQELTPSADLYSLGVVAYECLAGHIPFDGDTPVAVALRHVREVPAPLPDRIPAPVRDLVYGLLAKFPDERPASAAETADRAAAIRDKAGIVGPGLRRWTGRPDRSPGPGLAAGRPPAAPAASDAPSRDLIENPPPRPARIRKEDLLRGAGRTTPVDGAARNDLGGPAGGQIQDQRISPMARTDRFPGAPREAATPGLIPDRNDLPEFDGGPTPDSLPSGDGTARRRTVVTYASVAAGTLLLGVIVVGTMWRGLGTTEPLRDDQERPPAVQPGGGDPSRRLPADPATRLNEIERPGREASPVPTRERRTSTPRHPRASPSHKPTRKPPRATPSAPDPTPSPTESTTTPSTPIPDPSPTDSGELGSEDKV